MAAERSYFIRLVLFTVNFSEWKPPYPLLSAHHDCVSLASAWGLGRQTKAELDFYISADAEIKQLRATRKRTADGKSNKMVVSCLGFRYHNQIIRLNAYIIYLMCCIFRNELGGEPRRHLGLIECEGSEDTHGEGQTWHRENLAAEVSVLEDVSNVYLGGRLCAARQTKNVIEPQPLGTHYYRHCFFGRPHLNYMGVDESGDPVVISVIRENPSRSFTGAESFALYRLIVRLGYREPLRVSIPEHFISETADKSNRALLKELLDLTCPNINLNHLHAVPLTKSFEEALVSIDEQPIHRQHKIGVLYCGPEQCTELEMYNNETGSKDFDDFLDFLGQRILLKGFTNYTGGLDTEKMTCGTHSIYAVYQSDEVMFHVSTLLPYSANNPQQLSRKRHVGNDMVTVVFQDKGALPFTPSSVLSQFQRVFIIIRVNEGSGDDVTYSMAVSRDEDLPSFGPVIPSCAIFQRSQEFRDFLLAKIINAEEAAARSPKFKAYAARNRRESLRNLIHHYLTHREKSTGLASRFLGGSLRRRGRENPIPILSGNLRGALSWLVTVYDFSQKRWIRSVLGISAETIVLFNITNGLVLFSTPTHSVIGWSAAERYIKLYYDHGQMLLIMFDKAYGNDGLSTVIQRLEKTTKGAPAEEMLLRRFRNAEPLGFNYHDEGVITDVELYRCAWNAGLRQGARIVEIEGHPIISLTSEEIKVYLSRTNMIHLLIVPAAEDGSPRRGCEDPNCPAAKGNQDRGLVFEAFTRQILTYEEARRTSYFAGQPTGDPILMSLVNRPYERMAASALPLPKISDVPGRTCDSIKGHLQNYSISRSPRVPRSQLLKKWSGSISDQLADQCVNKFTGKLYRSRSEESVEVFGGVLYRSGTPKGDLSQKKNGQGPKQMSWFEELLEKDVSFNVISQISRDKIRLENSSIQLKQMFDENRRLMECVATLTAEINRPHLTGIHHTNDPCLKEKVEMDKAVAIHSGNRRRDSRSGSAEE
uniref:Rap-GAP domain-containing protein n=1 Tax=Syphacia muris TaxID=451379 RepID=A0A0N5AW08_9BILA